MIVSLDFETRSVADLRATGVYRYAEDPTTDLWCMAWAVGDGEPRLWSRGDPFPPELAELARDPATEWRAWNANFERTMWRHVAVDRYGFPHLPAGRWFCTAAEAAALSLPRRLEHCAGAVGLPDGKDMAGHRLMLQMCRPRTRDPLAWWDDEARLTRLGQYCLQDVRVERAIYERIRRLGPRERSIYLLDQRINDRGVALDVTLAETAHARAAAETKRQDAKVADATRDAVGAVTQVGALKDWLASEGIEIESLSKGALRELLEEGDLPDRVRAALEARRDGAKSSIKKIDRMLKVAGRDGRMRGLLLYHGASTGRWAGKLVQPHNFPRGTLAPDEIADAIAAVLAGDVPLELIASLLRPMLVPAPGYTFVTGDFSAIEARVLNWLAGQSDVVQMFARNEPVYKRMAGLIRGVPADTIVKPSDDYQLGKNTELGCGYGMGKKKFEATTGVTPELAERAVDTYRASHRSVVQFWYDLNDAAYGAVREPGTVRSVAGRLKFSVRGPYLWLALPSGRALAYPRPKIEPRRTPWGEIQSSVTYAGLNQYTRQYERIGLYGGLLAENVVQAVSRDLLVDACFRAEDAGYPIVLTVHDEIVAEPRAEGADLAHFLGLMRQVLDWAAGCPIEVEGWIGDRYRK